ncbi:MAG TPA: tRNA (5-methylaminomethyl-2-thiouridine)(34)-methyltransferase MnmD [Ramlibacter sp.]|nr:tRNA (5-methylaminomethyl-2-thiouridine)(34)-methyltransferase MnmD [Ramlibacter sp.]
MAEPVDWSEDGTPRSPRFDDVYRSSAGALAQARHVFLAGCGLPSAWTDQPRWTVLETGFGLGLNFLATWQAWRSDPARCGLLHYVATEAFPVAPGDLVRSAAAHPELAPLARELASRWWGLVPGVHRLSFEQGGLLLTLAIGDSRAQLQELSLAADAVFLDGFDPQRNPAMWELPLLKAVARCCRRGAALATWTVAGRVRRDLQQCGFVLQKVLGLPPKRECLRGHYEPGWTVRRQQATAASPSEAVVVGGGVAGAAAAAALARRGWRVQVLDAAVEPASGASRLPAGLLAPHTSPDDGLLSRLSRAGVRMTLEQCRALLREGEDYGWTGVLEHRSDDRPLPDLGAGQGDWQRRGDDPHAVWHAAGAWIKPAALARAWLAQPGVSWRGGTHVRRLQSGAQGWQALDGQGAVAAEAPLVVVAAALDTARLLDGGLVLNPVRGQVSWDLHAGDLALPQQPVNGNGHFLPDVPLAAGRAWLSGSTYVRGDRSLQERQEEHAANLARLAELVPDTAAALRPRFEGGQVRAWTGIRCASSDRRPLVGEARPGLWVSTAMGSRGLTFAWLCAELLAARLHAEPWPLPNRLAAALDVGRQAGATSA